MRDVLAMLAQQTPKSKRILPLHCAMDMSTDNVSALIDASTICDLAEVRRLVEIEHVDVNSSDEGGLTALIMASVNGHLEIVKYLVVEGGAEINSATTNGKTAVSGAIRWGYLEVVKYLVVEKGAVVNVGEDERTALMLASKNGHLEVVKCLVERGAEVNSANWRGVTALMMASQYGHLEIVKCLVEGGAEVNSATTYGDTALMLASKEGHLEVVKCLVEGGAGVNSANSYGFTALMWASRRGHLEIVKYLVDRGAEVNSADKDGVTSVSGAISLGYLEVVQYLVVEKGAVVNVDDGSIHRNQSEIIKVVLPRASPAAILKLSKRHPVQMCEALSKLSAQEIEHCCYIKDSYLMREEEKVYHGSDDASMHGVFVLHEYDYRPLFWWVRRAFSGFDFVKDDLREYRLPLNNPTHITMLKAYLFVSMSQSKPQLFDKDTVIGNAVEAAWQQYGWRSHVVTTAVYITYLVLTTLLNYNFHHWIDTDEILSLTLTAFIMIFSSFFMLIEARELWYHRADKTLHQYFSDGMNYLDWTAYSLVFAGCVMRVISLSETNDSASVMAIGTMLLWLKLTHFLRPFESTGPLVRMIFFIMYKIKWLLLIMFFAIISMAQALYLLSYGVEGVRYSNPGAGLIQLFVTMMGQIEVDELHDTSNPKLAQFLLVAFILASTILLLNLLIAMMNAAYSAIARNSIAEWNRQRAIIITEQWHFYEPKIWNTQFYVIRNDFVKKLDEAKSHRAVDVKILNAVVKDSEGRMEEKMKESEKRIDEKMRESEKRILNAVAELLSELRSSKDPHHQTRAAPERATSMTSLSTLREGLCERKCGFGTAIEYAE